MNAGYYDIEAEEDSQYDMNFKIRDSNDVLIPLLGGTAKLEVRKKAGAAVVLTLTELSGITLADTEPNLNIRFLPTFYGHYVYDLIIDVPGGDSVRFLEGQFIVDRGVTQP